MLTNNELAKTCMYIPIMLIDAIEADTCFCYLWSLLPISQDDIDNTMLQWAVNASKQTAEPDIPLGYALDPDHRPIHLLFLFVFRSLAEVVNLLQSHRDDDIFPMVVRRSCLLDDALKRTKSKYFSPSKQIIVSPFTIQIVTNDIVG